MDDENDKRTGSSTLGSNVSNLVACLEKNAKVEDLMVFKQERLIKFKANNIDLDFATISKSTYTLTGGTFSFVLLIMFFCRNCSY